jgi:hypothetical protein
LKKHVVSKRSIIMMRTAVRFNITMGRLFATQLSAEKVVHLVIDIFVDDRHAWKGVPP